MNAGRGLDGRRWAGTWDKYRSQGGANDRRNQDGDDGGKSQCGIPSRIPRTNAQARVEGGRSHGGVLADGNMRTIVRYEADGDGDTGGAEEPRYH